jgi:hypothetical protein
MRRRSVVMLMVVAAGFHVAPGAVRAQKGPMKIGLILPETGPALLISPLPRLGGEGQGEGAFLWRP